MKSAYPTCDVAPMAGAIATDTGLQFPLPTVHCAACIGKIKRELASVIGVTTVRVKLSMKRLSISDDANPDTVLKTLSGLGFEAYPLDLEALNKARDDKGDALHTHSLRLPASR